MQKIEEMEGKEHKIEGIQIVTAIGMMVSLVLQMFVVKLRKIQELMVDKVITATTDSIEEKILTDKVTMEVLIETQF